MSPAPTEVNIQFPGPPSRSSLPAGGLTSQILRKSSNEDFDTEWYYPDDVATRMHRTGWHMDGQYNYIISKGLNTLYTYDYNGTTYQVMWHPHVPLTQPYRTGGVAQREFPDGDWGVPANLVAQVSEWPYQENDSHNSGGVIVDGSGRIHVSGNMHTDKLLYAITSTPNDISTFAFAGRDVINEGTSAVLDGATWEQTSFTYPFTVRLSNGDILLFVRSGDGYGSDPVAGPSKPEESAVWQFHYNHQTQVWTERGKVLSGLTSDSPVYTAGPYIGRPVVDSNDVIHIAGVWRWRSGLSGQANPFYLRSPDGGLTWEYGDGTTLSTPAKPEDEKLTVIEQGAQVTAFTYTPAIPILDSEGTFHCVFGEAAQSAGADLDNDPNVPAGTHAVHMYVTATGEPQFQYLDPTKGFNTSETVEMSIYAGLDGRVWAARTNRTPSSWVYVTELTPDAGSTPGDEWQLISEVPTVLTDSGYDSGAYDRGYLSLLLAPDGGNFTYSPDPGDGLAYGFVVTYDLNQWDSIVGQGASIPRIVKTGSFPALSDLTVNQKRASDQLLIWGPAVTNEDQIYTNTLFRVNAVGQVSEAGMGMRIDTDIELTPYNGSAVIPGPGVRVTSNASKAQAEGEWVMPLYTGAGLGILKTSAVASVYNTDEDYMATVVSGINAPHLISFPGNDINEYLSAPWVGPSGTMYWLWRINSKGYGNSGTPWPYDVAFFGTYDGSDGWVVWQSAADRHFHISYKATADGDSTLRDIDVGVSNSYDSGSLRETRLITFDGSVFKFYDLGTNETIPLPGAYATGIQPASRDDNQIGDAAGVPVVGTFPTTDGANLWVGRDPSGTYAGAPMYMQKLYIGSTYSEWPPKASDAGTKFAIDTQFPTEVGSEVVTDYSTTGATITWNTARTLGTGSIDQGEAWLETAEYRLL